MGSGRRRTTLREGDLVKAENGEIFMVLEVRFRGRFTDSMRVWVHEGGGKSHDIAYEDAYLCGEEKLISRL